MRQSPFTVRHSFSTVRQSFSAVRQSLSARTAGNTDLTVSTFHNDVNMQSGSCGSIRSLCKGVDDDGDMMR